MRKSSTLRKFAWFTFGEIKQRLFGTVYRAEFDITDNCNLRCSHCYHFHGKKEFRKKEVPLEEWEKRFKALHRQGIRYVLMCGGEPALRPDVLMLADKIFPLIYVITNGTIKIPQEFDNRLFVSIDGRQKTNNEIRGKGVFEKVLENYSGDKRAVLNMTLTEKNFRELEDVVLIAKQQGMHGTVCNIYSPSFGGTGPRTIPKKEREKIIAELRRVKKAYPGFLLMAKDMIDWYENPKPNGYCDWSEKALHFDVSWEKRKCYAKQFDCSNCGCLSGSGQNPIRAVLYPVERLRVI